MLKRGKKIMATLLATVMFFSIALTASAGTDYSVSADYFSMSNVVLPTNDYDTYCFSVPTARTCVMSFTVNNPDVEAVLFTCDGNNYPLSVVRRVTTGSLIAFNLSAGSYCWVVMPIMGTLGGTYQLAANVYNPAGLTGITATTNLSTVSGTLNGISYVNGVAQINEVITITGLSGGNGVVDYPGYGARYRIDRQQTLTVTGSVTHNGSPAPAGTPVQVRIIDWDWGFSTGGSNEPYYYSYLGTGVTNSQGNFTIGVVANNAWGANEITLPGVAPTYVFHHFFDLASVYAYAGIPDSSTGVGPTESLPLNIFIYAYSSV